MLYIRFSKSAFENSAKSQLLRSESPSLILTCGFLELVALCTVICRKKPHSCKDPEMATPLDFCRGISRPVNWYRYQDMWQDMWRTCEHVSRPCELVFALDLSMTSFHSVAVDFAILCTQRWISVNLNASTAAFIEIWGNCPCLFYILTNTTLNRCGNSYSFWLHLLISSSRDRDM